jgi:signal transduction histidine kinase/CheY-like chemotaxis protein
MAEASAAAVLIPRSRSARAVVTALGLYALLGGFASLLGWLADVPRATDWLGIGISIQPNTTLAVMSAGAATLLAVRRRRRPSAAFGAVVAAIGATALLQYGIGVTFERVNTLLMFGREWGRVGVTQPGLMGVAGATCWTLLGVGLILAARESGTRARRAVPSIALLTGSVATLSIVGYLYGSASLYAVPYSTVIALQTATFIAALSAALIALVPEQPPMRWLLSSRTAGTVARRSAPFVLIAPPVLGWLALTGQLAGWYDARFGVAILVLALMGLLTLVLSWNLVTIRRHEAALRRSERRLVETLERRQADYEAIARLHALGNTLVPAGDLEPLLAEILSAAADLTGASKGNIQLYDADSNALRIVVHQGHGARFLERFGERRSIEGSGRAALTLQRLVVEDLAEESRLAGSVDYEVMTGDGIRAFQATPLLSRDGGLRGVLYNHFPERHRPDEHQLRYLDLLARMAADFIERSQREQKLREADRRKDEFLAMLSHELRNPLAPISNAAGVLRMAGDDREAVSSASGMIDRQVRQMIRLVDDLLDVSRITRGKIELRTERVDLGSAIGQAVESTRWLAEGMAHELQLTLPARPIHVHADRARLVQVFGNLLHNACKFTEKGGRISVSLEREDGEAVVRVEDTGLGLAADQLPRIFDMFTQVDTSLGRSVGGLGIGLTLVKTLVDLHGGSVNVRSDGLGQGSEFTVRLAVAPEDFGAQRAAAGGAEPAALPRRRVLVVDDNRDSAESLALMLEMSGSEARTAHDGPAAIDAASEFRPDLVLLDIGLPELTGYEVCRRIRQEPWGREMLLVAVTGWGQDDDREKSRQAGFDAHFVKPIEFDAIRALLANAGAARA